MWRSALDCAEASTVWIVLDVILCGEIVDETGTEVEAVCVTMLFDFIRCLSQPVVIVSEMAFREVLQSVV